MRIIPSLLLIGVSVGALAGCSVAPPDTRAALELTGAGQAAGLPMAQLPAASGDLVSVVESVDQGVLTQKIVLKGDSATWGENGVVVVVDQRADLRPGNASWAAPKPTETLIDRELKENFASIDMGVGQSFTRNSFGPFGYALGKTGSDVTCLYAWQFSPGHMPLYVRDPEKEALQASTPVSPTSVRVRLCRQHASQAELVAMVAQMSVFPPHSGTPYVDPTYKPDNSTPGDALEATGLPGAFYTGSRKAAALEDSPEPVRQKHKKKHHAHKHHHAVAYTRPAPDDGGALDPVIVPPLAAATAPSVPLAGAPAVGAPSAPVAGNPLTAALRTALAAKKKPAPDDLPLPGGPAAGAAAPAQAAAVAPIPLPQ